VRRASPAELPNPLDVVFPSETGTPLDRRNVRRRHFKPAMTALKIPNVRGHDLRRTLVFVHAKAGTHPKQVQERAGHTSLKVTWDVYGKMVGKLTLSADQRARLDGVATTALPGEVADPAPPTDTPPKYRQERLSGRRLRLKGKKDGAAAEGEER